MRVVLDTNVIVSGLNFPGNERLVLELALRGRFELCLSPFILDEVAGVLVGKFDWAEERSAQALRALGDAATVVETRRLPEVIEGGHPDNRILECAVEASADYLVTGDRRHLLPLQEHQGVRIPSTRRSSCLSSLRHVERRKASSHGAAQDSASSLGVLFLAGLTWSTYSVVAAADICAAHNALLDPEARFAALPVSQR